MNSSKAGSVLTTAHSQASQHEFDRATLSRFCFLQAISEKYSTLKESKSTRIVPQDASPAGLSKKHKGRLLFTKPSPIAKITVSTGTDKRQFDVHKDLMCYHSPFFKAAFEGGFKEARTQKMTLKDVDSRVFGLMVHWMYRDEVYVEEEKEDQEKLGDTTVLDTSIILTLADLWILADRFLMPILQNKTMDKLCYLLYNHHETMLLPFIRHVYENTESRVGHPLKHLALSCLAVFRSSEELADLRDGLPHDVAFDLAMAYQRGFLCHFKSKHPSAKELYVATE